MTNTNIDTIRNTNLSISLQKPSRILTLMHSYQFSCMPVGRWISGTFGVMKKIHIYSFFLEHAYAKSPPTDN